MQGKTGEDKRFQNRRGGGAQNKIHIVNMAC